MARICAGDESAFELLYHRHHRQVYTFLLSRTRSEALAADFCQEAFLRLWQTRCDWTPRGSVVGYLLRAAKSMTVDEHRRRQVREDRRQDVADRDRSVFPTPDEALENQEVAARIAAAIDALPQRTREVFILKRERGLSYREIGDELGISPNTVGVHMYRALKALRERLRDLL